MGKKQPTKHPVPVKRMPFLKIMLLSAVQANLSVPEMCLPLPHGWNNPPPPPPPRLKAGLSPRSGTAARRGQKGGILTATPAVDWGRGHVLSVPALLLLPHCRPETRAVTQARCSSGAAASGWWARGGPTGRTAAARGREPLSSCEVATDSGGSAARTRGVQCAWRGTALTPTPALPRGKIQPPP